MFFFANDAKEHVYTCILQSVQKGWQVTGVIRIGNQYVA